MPAASAAAASVISRSALEPFIARTDAAGSAQGQGPAEQPVQRRHRPRGDHVEAGAGREAPRPDRAPPRRCVRPRSATTSSRKVVRRSSGSTSVTRRSGRRIATTRPGQPRTAADVADRGALRHAARSATAQLSRCRSHSRGTSRGPISPRTVACAGQPARVRGRERQAVSENPRGLSRAAGAFHVKPSRSSASGRSHHDVPPRLDAVGVGEPGRPRPPRRGPPCARTGSSGRAPPARPSAVTRATASSAIA